MIRNFKEQDPRWVTHVRVVAHDVTTMPSPEVRALARADLFVDRHLIVKHTPVARTFATATDERRRGLIACTPATLAATVWVPRPPGILVGYGAAVWDWFTPALTRGVGRVDMGKISRLLWPEGPTRDVMRMADYVQSGGPARTETGSAADRLAGQVQAVADIMSTALLVAGDQLVGLAAAAASTDTPGLGDTLGSMAGDPRLQAMVQLSAAPMAPLAPVPAPWDEAENWFALGAEELAWIATDQRASDYERDAAAAEMARRKVRDEALLKPRSLLRRLGLD
jgi:hypothetical protein